MQALVAVDGGTRARLALQVEYLRAVGEILHDGVGLRLAALDVVGADMVQDARDVAHLAVDGDDRHTGLHRLLQRRRHGVDIERRDDDRVDLLGNRRLDVAGLLRHFVLAVRLDQLDVAQRLGLGGKLLLHMHKKRKRQAWQRRCDGQRLAGGARRRDASEAGGDQNTRRGQQPAPVDRNSHAILL